MSILKISNLVKEYKSKDEKNNVKALDGVTLEVEKADFTAVMGPSGSGKSTLLNLISGIDKATSGCIEINQQNIVEMKEDLRANFRKKNIGIVFQDFNLLDSLTIKENIMIPLILCREDNDFMDKEADKLLKMFNIVECADKYPCNISGGQKQRAAICRAVINNPNIVLADEPTGNLDSKSSKDVMSCFEKMNKSLNTTILMVTHDPYAASFCNKIVFIKDGKVDGNMIKNEEQSLFLDRILKHLSIIGGGKGDL